VHININTGRDLSKFFLLLDTHEMHE